MGSDYITLNLNSLCWFFPSTSRNFLSFGTQRWKIPRAFFDLLKRKNKIQKNKGNGEVLSTNLHICSKLFFAAPFPINLTFLLSWGMWRKLNSLFSTSSWHSLRFIFTHMKCFDSFFKCTNPSSSSWKVHLEIYTPIFLYKEFSEFWRLALYTPPRTFFSSRIKFLYHFKKNFYENC